jgi:hypothetical protein
MKTGLFPAPFLLLESIAKAQEICDPKAVL